MEGEAQGIELPLPVAAVDRGDVYCDMAFVVESSRASKVSGESDHRLQAFQVVEDGIESLVFLSSLSPPKLTIRLLDSRWLCLRRKWIMVSLRR